MMALKVLTAAQLPESVQSKVKRFVQRHCEQTKMPADYIVQAPGRVNLIGDHIDYHGFSVLPMAIDSSIWMGCSVIPKRPSEGDGHLGTVKIINNDSTSYPDAEFVHSFSYGRHLDTSHKWHNYILCGYHGVLASELLGIPPDDTLKHAKHVLSDQQTSSRADQKLSNLCDITLFIDADLIPASGLSSSSALVCASAIATHLLLHESLTGLDKKLNINCRTLAEQCSRYEHLIGTHGGGMDQAVILTAQKGYAKLVEFMPSFKCENICLPDKVTWIISHCGNDYPKAATSNFNMRVLETKLAASLIVKKMNHDIPQDGTITLARVKNEIFNGKTAAEIVNLLKEVVFPEGDMTIEEILTQLELTRSSLIERFDASERILADSDQSRLKLFDRCRHVFEEAERVQSFRAICVAGGDIVALGRIMTESHYSLRDSYECSHPDLDRLVELALEAGALGARLTGAGWGGCIVTLVDRSKCEYVMDKLQKASKFTFRTEPQDGCKIIKI